MGWLFETLIEWFWIGIVEAMSEGKPWWVWALWALSPLWAFGILLGLLWLFVR